MNRVASVNVVQALFYLKMLTGWRQVMAWMSRGKGKQGLPFLMIVILCSSFVYADSAHNKKPAEVIHKKGKRFEKVMTLNGSEQNIAFRKHVDLLKLQKKKIDSIKKKLNDNKISQEERNSLEKKKEKRLRAFVKNQKAVLKRYGYSLKKNYLIVIEKASLYRPVDNNIAERMLENPEYSEENQKVMVYEDIPMIEIVQLNSKNANAEFQQNISLVNAQKKQLNKLKSQYQSMRNEGNETGSNTDLLLKKSLFEEMQSVYKKNLKKLKDNYGVGPDTPFYLDIQKSYLYVLAPAQGKELTR